MRTGKIARLPLHIRHELNARLQDGEPGTSLLDWLNSLPDVQAILAADFGGRPVNPTNLTEWKNGGYRDWLVRQDALNLFISLDDEHTLGHQSFNNVSSEKLLHWLSLQYAAATQSLDSHESQPHPNWARLRELCAVISRLRRLDLLAERLRLEREHLALAQANSAANKEKEFWAWTERPDIQDQLYPPDSDDNVSLLDLCLGKRPAPASPEHPANSSAEPDPTAQPSQLDNEQ